MAYTRLSYYKFVCDSRADVANLPTQTTKPEDAPMGATAIIIDDNGNGAAVVSLNSDGQWKDL